MATPLQVDMYGNPISISMGGYGGGVSRGGVQYDQYGVPITDTFSSGPYGGGNPGGYNGSIGHVSGGYGDIGNDPSMLPQPAKGWTNLVRDDPRGTVHLSAKSVEELEKAMQLLGTAHKLRGNRLRLQNSTEVVGWRIGCRVCKTANECFGSWSDAKNSLASGLTCGKCYNEQVRYPIDRVRASVFSNVKRYCSSHQSVFCL